MNAIKTNDPQAIDMLMKKLADLERLQDIMKSANAILRKLPLSDDQKKEAMISAGFTAQQYESLKQPDFCGRIGFPDYKLTNNGAEIRRLRKRIQLLKDQKDTIQDKVIDCGPFREIHNVDAGRLQLDFPGKPSEKTRDLLKSRGFKWSPTNMVWQRLLSFQSISVLNQIVPKILEYEKEN